jgi:hypothetical protein
MVEGDEATAPIPMVISLLGVDGSVQPVALPIVWRGRYINPTGYAQDGTSIWFFGHGFALARYDPKNGLRDLNIQVPQLAPMFEFEIFAVSGRCVAA